MKRLFLLMVFLAVSVQANAAKMSSYTENTTPNADVYFIGVDPNDTTQTPAGSNYRYPLSGVIGSGLLDADFNSLAVSGTGDSWVELNNNTSFTDSLTGKYGLRFYNGVLQQIINGTASAIGSGSFAFDTYPTYEDSAHSSGIAVNGTTLAVYSETASKWLTVGLTDTLDPTPATYALTLAVSGEGSITIGSTEYTSTSSPHTITGLSGATSLTTAYGGSNDLLTWSGTDAADVSGTYPDYSITMDEAKSITATFSVAETNRFEWAAEDLTAEVFDATDGDTIVVASEGTPSHSFVTGQTNNAIQLASGSWCYIPATNTNNIVLAGDTIRFHFRRVSGTSSSAHRVISVGNTDLELDFRRSSAGETRYGMSVAGASYFQDTTENIYDGNWHYIILTWNSSAQTYSFQIDSSTYSGSLTTTDVPTPGTNRIYFGGYSAATSALVVNYDNVEVE